MLLVFCALRNVSSSDDNYILKFFTEGLENLPSSFFFLNPKICNKMAHNNGTALLHETDFDISKDHFC